MALLSDIITYVDGLKPNPYTNAQKIAWLNHVDENVKLKVMKVFKGSKILRVADTSSYSLPATCIFEYVENVYINGFPIAKIDYRAFEETGFYKIDATHFGIYPVPTVSDAADDDAMWVAYLEAFTPYTLITETLLIPNQHKAVYENYLFAQINRFNRDWGDYNNEMMQYNASWMEFERWYQARAPINKSSVIKNIW